EQLQKISSFATTSEQAQGGLAGKIAALKQSIPEVFANSTDAGKPSNTQQIANTPNATVSRAQSSGLIGQASFLLTQTREIHRIDALIVKPNHLRDTGSQLQKPLRDSLKGLVQQGRSMADATSASSGQVADAQKQLQQLTDQFKH